MAPLHSTMTSAIRETMQTTEGAWQWTETARAHAIHKCALIHGSISTIPDIPGPTATKAAREAYYNPQHICVGCAHLHPRAYLEAPPVSSERTTISTDPSKGVAWDEKMPPPLTSSQISILGRNSKIDSSKYDPSKHQDLTPEQEANGQKEDPETRRFRGPTPDAFPDSEIEGSLRVVDYLGIPPQRAKPKINGEEYRHCGYDPKTKKKRLDLKRPKVPCVEKEFKAAHHRSLHKPGEDAPWKALDTNVKRAHEEYTREYDRMQSTPDGNDGNDEDETQQSSHIRRKFIGRLTDHSIAYLRDWSERNSAAQGQERGVQLDPPVAPPTFVDGDTPITQDQAADFLVSNDAPTYWERPLQRNWPKDRNEPRERAAKNRMGLVLGEVAKRDVEVEEVLAKMPTNADADHVLGGTECEIFDVHGPPDELEREFDKPNVRIGEHDPDEKEFCELKQFRKELARLDKQQRNDDGETVDDALMAGIRHDSADAVKVVEQKMEVVRDKMVKSGKVVAHRKPKKPSPERRDSVVGDSVVGDSVVGDSVVGDSVVRDSVVGDSVVGDSVVRDPTGRKLNMRTGASALKKRKASDMDPDQDMRSGKVARRAPDSEQFVCEGGCGDGSCPCRSRGGPHVPVAYADAPMGPPPQFPVHGNVPAGTSTMQQGGQVIQGNGASSGQTHPAGAGPAAPVASGGTQQGGQVIGTTTGQNHPVGTNQAAPITNSGTQQGGQVNGTASGQNHHAGTGPGAHATPRPSRSSEARQLPTRYWD